MVAVERTLKQHGTWVDWEAGRRVERKASTPVQVARSQQKERNAWAPWGVKMKLISLVEGAICEGM